MGARSYPGPGALDAGSPSGGPGGSEPPPMAAGWAVPRGLVIWDVAGAGLRAGCVSLSEPCVGADRC